MQDIQKYPTVTSLQLHQADPSLEKDKKSIYGHSLYPLLSLLLEQCEQATSSPESNNPDTFEADLQSYIQRNENNDKLMLSDNKELDNLMVKAIQVLRIHLIELRKVNELCKDFCSRYINCLKTKIHSDSMFDDSEESSQNDSERLSPVMPGNGNNMNSSYNSPYSTNNNNGSTTNRNFMGNPGGLDCLDFLNGSGGSTGSPLSSSLIGPDDSNNNSLNQSSANYNPQSHIAHHLTHHPLHGHHGFSNLLDPSKQKRGVLPKKATQIMKQWLFQHLVHPYPTEDEKRQIANQTNLTLLQVNNWFINARRRILQPMLDTSNSPVGNLMAATSGSANIGGKDKLSNNPTSPGKSGDKISDNSTENGDAADKTNSSISSIYSSSCANRKKKAATNRPSNNRFWPASLAAAVSILSPHTTSHSATKSTSTTNASMNPSNTTTNGCLSTTTKSIATTPTSISTLKSTPLTITVNNQSEMSNRKRHSASSINESNSLKFTKSEKTVNNKSRREPINSSTSSNENSPTDQYMPPELNLNQSGTSAFPELSQSHLPSNLIGSLVEKHNNISPNKLINTDIPLLSHYASVTQPDPLLSYPLFGGGPPSHNSSSYQPQQTPNHPPSQHSHQSPSPFIPPSLSLSALTAAAAQATQANMGGGAGGGHHLQAAASLAYNSQRSDMHSPLYSAVYNMYDTTDSNNNTNSKSQHRHISSLFTQNWPPPPPPNFDPSYPPSSSIDPHQILFDPHHQPPHNNRPPYNPGPHRFNLSHTNTNTSSNPFHTNTNLNYDHHSFSNFAMKALKSTNPSDNI